MADEPMHPRMVDASHNAAVITLSEAAGVLNPPEPDPLDTIALQADSDPDAITIMSKSLTNGANELDTGAVNLINAVRIMAAAWKGRRHQIWGSHASAVMDYYEPTVRFLRRSKPGVRGLARQTAEVTAAIGASLDTATTAVASSLTGLAELVFASSVAVADGKGTPEDELNVRQAIAGVQNSLEEFEQTVGAIDKEQLIDTNLVRLQEFSGEGAGMANDPTEDNLLRIQFPGFEDALTQLTMSASEALQAGEHLTEASKITSFDGRSPFGASGAATVLRVNWTVAVSWRISEADQARTQTMQLRTTAEQARDDYLEVDQRNADSFDAINPD